MTEETNDVAGPYFTNDHLATMIKAKKRFNASSVAESFHECGELDGLCISIKIQDHSTCPEEDHEDDCEEPVDETDLDEDTEDTENDEDSEPDNSNYKEGL